MSIHVQTQVDVDNSGDESDVRSLHVLPLTSADLIPSVLDVFPKKDGQRLRPQYSQLAHLGSAPDAKGVRHSRQLPANHRRILHGHG